MEALTLMQEEEHVVIEDGMSVWGQAAKRTFDCLLAAVLLIVFSPLFLICYIAVRLEDGAPEIGRASCRERV